MFILSKQGEDQLRGKCWSGQEAKGIADWPILGDGG